jgi:hypothetical protein
MKRVLAGSLTAIIMGFLIWNSLNRHPLPGRVPTDIDRVPRLENRAGLEEATACVEGLIAGARGGDVARYLGAFASPLRERLEQESAERGRDAFAVLLRKAAEARTSHAIFAPEPDGDRTDAARITVESTFADRLERQTFRLERSARGWKIAEIETVREQVPKNPLGALATFDAPEGPPVEAYPDATLSDSVKN